MTTYDWVLLWLVCWAFFAGVLANVRLDRLERRK